jgi:hypothetical protein
MRANIESVRALLDQGVAVDSRGFNQSTPLLITSARGHGAVAALLLDRGANVNAKENAGGGTPAIYASLNGHLDTLQLLVSREADIHHRTEIGYSSLLEAALHDHLPVCEYLLSLGADLMALSIYNETALTHYGCKSNDYRGLSPETKALRRAALQRAWENGPHPSQIKRRCDERWIRRGSFITVLAENGYRPLQARALEIALAALAVDPNEPVIVPRTSFDDVFRNDNLVRYIAEFL